MRQAKCPHCGKPVSIKIHIDAYESKRIITSKLEKELTLVKTNVTEGSS